mgnify:CR=1 FL=1
MERSHGWRPNGSRWTRNHGFPQFNESGAFMQLEQGTIRTTDSPSWSQTKSTELKSLWTILAGLTTWHVWKPIPRVEVVMEHWDHLITFLGGSYEDIQGKTDWASRTTGNLHFEMEWNDDVAIARRQYTMVLSPAEMALPTEDSPHATFPHHPWTVEGSL